MKISDLRPNEKNPRTITDEKLAALKKALTEFGDISGIVFNRKTKRLAGGHQRLKHLDPDSPITIIKKYSKPTKTGTVGEGYVELNGERLSYREVYWSDAKEKAANLAANKGAGSWDLPQLSEWLKELNSFDVDFDLSLTMFDEDELKEFGTITVSEHERTGKTGVDEDEVPEKAPARSGLGDIYQLGRHRLLCGDSTDLLAVEKLMNGEKVDMVFTDPPYGISIVKRSGTVGATSKVGFVSPRSAPSQVVRARQYKTIIGDDTPFEPQMILDLKIKTIVLWGANHYASKLPDRPQWLIWDKKIESGTLDKNNFSDCELAWTNSTALSARIYRHTWAGMLRSGDRKEELKVRVHPTQKPVGLCEEVIEDFSEVNEIVLDLFGGSGSTLIACEKTNRKCFMMELDPHYCDVIVERWEKYTGEKAKLLPKVKTVLRKTAKPSISRHAQNH